MIQKKYVSLIREIKNQHLPNRKAFLFGSSLQDKAFRDVDIGVMGQEDGLDLTEFREALEESMLPYLADVVDFGEVTEKFKKEVFKQRIVWL